MACPSPLLILTLFLFSLNQVSYAETDTLKPGQQLHDWQQLVSEGEVFRLGFFNPNPKSSVDIGVSGPRYIGIWFNNTPFYSVWVANRENPVPDSSGTLTVDTHGKLQITYQDGSPIVINPGQAVTKRTSRGNFTATLLDSGNLVLRQVLS
ncbi:G-type lectin S-receptor-like serine/threonine-protein kinase At1g67520 [Diospyros lotus]|uniref:G-type lectin S-receptor-like serine/threonine-protein kinase At1g67520 n=1 Tax=Diospyros lotus TaxID=55363 RepID=UPI002254A263|nr:G-type lectin S-receptor-like serine/threonine-protein kinase At1g67520 [Diospyros lotus]